LNYFFVALLTIAISFVILRIVKKNEQHFLKSFSYRQSDIHSITKKFYTKNNIKQNKETQLTKRIDSSNAKIILAEDKAYWVDNNIFYIADIINDHPDMSTAKPIDTSNLSKEDIDKMLFILDNLGRGKKDERGSSGN